ncbi:hypothetical protein LTR08_006148 [Meristemomyces frigidus]|nr:hypothetical protein LTR08_006148 [Meristemomyces frigidus]
MASFAELLSGEVSARSTAPVHSVPSEMIVSIEHPCVIRNFDNGFKSLGGEPQLKHILDHRVGDSLIKLDGKTGVFPEPVAGVSLRPHDPLAKKISSKGIETNNLLLKVTLPKRTGRKRKRGSNDPFTVASPSRLHGKTIRTPELLRRLRDNENAYSIQPIGVIHETHRFRDQVDYQMHTSDFPIMTEVRDHALNPSYNSLKKLRVDLRPGTQGITEFPLPPTLTTHGQPYRYEYQQAQDVIFSLDADGNATSGNRSAGQRKRQIQPVAADALEVPQGPPSGFMPMHLNEDLMTEAVNALNELLDKRPLVTKRVAHSVIPTLKHYIWVEAWQRVGYMFGNGPFRDVLVKYGVDPRSDPKYRIYQMLTFAPTHGLKANSAVRVKHEDNDISGPYTFDGTAATAVGRTWQVCDVTDPLLYDLLHTDEVRPQCDVHAWGWYYSGTIGKARVMMRDKFKRLAAGETPPEEDYAALLTLPNKMTIDNIGEARLDPAHYSAHAVELCQDFRALVKNTAARVRRSGVGVGDEDLDDVDAQEMGTVQEERGEEDGDGEFS